MSTSISDLSWTKSWSNLTGCLDQLSRPIITLSNQLGHLIIVLLLRVFFKKEDSKRYKEKLFVKNFNIKKKNNSILYWFHAASIGEFRSIVPIIKNLNENKKNTQFLITTTTLSSSHLVKKEFNKFDNIFHRFMPLDINHLINKFLNGWKPKKIFLVDHRI